MAEPVGDAFARVLGGRRGSNRADGPAPPRTPLERARALVAWMSDVGDDEDVLAYVRDLQSRAAELSLTVDVGIWRPAEDHHTWTHRLTAISDDEGLVGFISDGPDGPRLLRYDQPMARCPRHNR